MAQGLKIEPSFGAERKLQTYPAPTKYHYHPLVGIRVLYGTSMLSGELELNQSIYEENDDIEDLKVNYVGQRSMLGVRTYIVSQKYVGIFLRGGICATSDKLEITQNNKQSVETIGMRLDPYLGTGLTIPLGATFALNGSMTGIFNREYEKQADRLDTQWTMSVVFKTGKTE